jgi:hypothetical protein
MTDQRGEALTMTTARIADGRVAFVGSGPGDVDLLTARATELLAKASLVVTDPDVPQGALALAGEEAEVRPAVGESGEVAKDLASEAEAGRLVAEMRARAAAVGAALANAERPRTFYEVGLFEGAIYTAGEGSFLASLIELAGGEPITGDAFGTIDAEELVAADPQLILLGNASYDPTLADPNSAREAVAARPGWGDLSAVAMGRVVPFTDDIVTTRPGPRIVDGLEALARAIHPDRFD